MLTKHELEIVQGLRDKGYAVCIFNPKELNGADSGSVEEEMCCTGWEAIESLTEEEGE